MAKTENTTSEIAKTVDPKSSFVEEFGVNERQSRYMRGRLNQVKDAGDVDAFIAEFANNAHKANRMREQLEAMLPKEDKTQEGGNDGK